MWAKLKEKINEARLSRTQRLKRASSVVDNAAQAEQRPGKEKKKSAENTAINENFPVRHLLAGCYPNQTVAIYGSELQPVTNWLTVRDEATFAKIVHEYVERKTDKTMYKLDLPDECSWAEKGERNYYTFSQPPRDGVRTVLSNYPLPFQRYVIFELQLDSAEGTFCVGFAPKPPVYDNVIGYYSNSIGLSAQGGLFASLLRETLRSDAFNDGEQHTVTFLIDRDPDLVEGVVEAAPGWGAMLIFIDDQLITEDAPVCLPILRLPAPFEPPGAHRIRSNNPAKEDGSFETVACPRRSDWGELPALYPAVTFSQYCSFVVNFGERTFHISRLDDETKEAAEKLLGGANLEEVLEEARLGYSWDAGRLNAYRISKLAGQAAAEVVAVSKEGEPQAEEDEDDEDEEEDEEEDFRSEDCCRFVNNLRACTCPLFVAHADLHDLFTSERCDRCGHARLWHKSLPHEQELKKKPVDERWAALNGKSSAWRKATVATEVVFYNTKTREIVHQQPENFRFREALPVVQEAPDNENPDLGAKSSEASESGSGSRRRRSRKSRSSRHSSSSDGESVAISSAYVPIEIKDKMIPPKRAPSSSTSKTPPSVVSGAQAGEQVSVHRVFVPSVASQSAKISNDSLKHDLSIYRRKLNLTHNALAEELLPEGDREWHKKRSERRAKELRETITRKHRMGHDIPIVFADDSVNSGSSSSNRQRRESEATVPTIKAAFSDFNVSRRTSGML